jgi:putative hydrolase of the HAD superfamily
MRLAELDAVTLDCLGTLVELEDPVPALTAALAHHGATVPSPDLVDSAFRTEALYYREHLREGHDARSLDELRRRCVDVFLRACGVELDAAAFTSDFTSSLRFRVLHGVDASLRSLRSRGLELVVVSNWDISLHERLAELGLRALLSDVVTSAEAGADKPDPAVFQTALAGLGDIPAGRALHVGDSPADEAGAAAAGLKYEPAPLHEAVRRWS